MKRLAAVVVIALGCKMANCQGVDTTARRVIGGEANRVAGRAVAGDTGRMAGSGGIVTPGDPIREISLSTGWGSKADTVPRFDWNQKLPAWKQPFPVKSFYFPAALIAYGAMAIHNGTLQGVNKEVKEQIWEDMPHKKTTIDNILLFSPAISVYALNALGIHGEHNFRDRTIIYVMANVIANSAVFSVKGWSHEMRPDGSDRLSFPSGHTAEAFASAEFMRLEYKNVSPWYGVAGYAMATATGILRMYNNKHWMSDVAAGAGVGIASTRLAYWLYPKVQHLFGKKDIANDNGPVSMVMPTYSSGTFGLAYVKTF